MKPHRVLFVFGTRPEAIKMAPVIKQLKNFPRRFEVIVAVTAQHRELLDRVLEIFHIRPDYDLRIMRQNQTPSDVTVASLKRIKPVLAAAAPQIVLVQGDATSAFAAALAAYYQKIPVGHIEAGLRTYDKYAPFPEEANRRFITTIADYHFAPTAVARANLLREGVPRSRIYLTGNTVIDALYLIRKLRRRARLFPSPPARGVRRILVTLHRRESFGRPLCRILRALRELVRRNSDVEIVYPVHPNPNVRQPVKELLGGKERIRLIEPLDYPDFVCLLEQTYLVLTDSGGVTEEAPALGKPVLILREKTERPEAIHAGVARLVGTATERIIEETEKLLSSNRRYRQMQKWKSPFGDGRAAQRIQQILERRLSDGE